MSDPTYECVYKYENQIAKIGLNHRTACDMYIVWPACIVRCCCFYRIQFCFSCFAFSPKPICLKSTSEVVTSELLHKWWCKLAFAVVACPSNGTMQTKCMCFRLMHIYRPGMLVVRNSTFCKQKTKPNETKPNTECHAFRLGKSAWW